MNEENGFAAIEFRKEFIEGVISDAFSEDSGAGRDTYHAGLVERAGHFIDRRLNVRKRRAGESRKTLWIFADDSRVKIIGKPGGIDCGGFVRAIWELAGDGKDLQIHVRESHVANIFLD